MSPQQIKDKDYVNISASRFIYFENSIQYLNFLLKFVSAPALCFLHRLPFPVEFLRILPYKFFLAQEESSW